jgi:tRNA-dihydrouridine synthase B
MINCRTLAHSSAKTFRMMRTSGEDRPLGIQFLGSDENFILKSLEKIQGLHFDIVDFNAACPQRKVASRGEGAALLKNPKKLASLLKLIAKNHAGPVSVKMRLGWDNCSKASDIALSCQDAGINVLFVHGRTKEQGYSGVVNYSAIAGIKKKLDIPVVASGDILNAELAKNMFDETGCDAITVARGSLGNPWIFREIRGYLKNGKILSRPSIKELVHVMLLHFKLLRDFYGDKRGVKHFKKFFIWYTRGFEGAKPMRNEISRIHTVEGIEMLIERFRKDLCA